MADFEIRSSAIQSDGQKLTGYVVKWDKPSEVLYGEFIECFSPHAFKQSLEANTDIRALFEHDHTKLLGRTRSGTLSLREDSTGLYFELIPPDTTLGKDLLVSVSRGDIQGMSFGFIPTSEEWNFETTPYTRTIKGAELKEITVTSIPAYPDSNVQLAKRSMELAKNAHYDKQLSPLFARWVEVEEL
ncbi:peptidase [Gallibacterium anatis]|uniref:Peptidase n=2 Tax=Gallibacterium anatis TaxID=750 RepID=A0A0A2XNM7_9PAST|nr:peptidase [Gallibacterium anatis]